MFGSLLFLILALTGAVVATRHGLIPRLGAMPQWATSLLGGAIAGGLLAGLVHFAWKRLAVALDEEGAGAGWRLINSFLLGFVVTGVGAILYAAIGLIFASGVGVRIAQGTILGGSLLLGLRVGYLLESPLFSFGLPGLRPTGQVRMKRAGANKILDTSVIIDGRIG